MNNIETLEKMNNEKLDMIRHVDDDTLDGYMLSANIYAEISHIDAAISALEDLNLFMKTRIKMHAHHKAIVEELINGQNTDVDRACEEGTEAERDTGESDYEGSGEDSVPACGAVPAPGLHRPGMVGSGDGGSGSIDIRPGDSPVPPLAKSGGCRWGGNQAS